MIILLIILAIWGTIAVVKLIAELGSTDSISEKVQENTHNNTPANQHKDNHPNIDHTAVKSRFLEKNSNFSELLINNILCSGHEKLSWILELENSEQYAVRTVFLGYNDLYCFIGTPLEPAFRTENNFPWPNTFWVMNGGQTVTHYKYQRFTYADQLGFAPISDYQGISRQTVLGWIAEDVRSRFDSLHPELNVSNINFSIQGGNCYYYFSFYAAGKSLSGWN